MTSFTLREYDCLLGAFNFTLWKCTLQKLLEEVDMWCFVEAKVAIPTDHLCCVNHNKKASKVKRIMLNLVKDYLITHITKKTTKDMYDALVILYQNVSFSCKMLLKNKLISICTSDTDIVRS